MESDLLPLDWFSINRSGNSNDESDSIIKSKEGSKTCARKTKLKQSLDVKEEIVEDVKWKKRKMYTKKKIKELD